MYRLELIAIITGTKIRSAKSKARIKMTTALILPAIAPDSDAESPLGSVNCSELGLVNILHSPGGQSGA